MIDDHTLELINREIDGLNSSEETALLQGCLRKDPPAQELYDDLVKLGSMLKTVTTAEPPRYLKTAILNSIQYRRPQEPRRVRISGIGEFFRSLKLTPARALTFAAGLALGIIAFTFIPGKGLDDRTGELSNLYGTMMFSDLVAALPVSDQKTFDLGDVQATATLKSSKTLVLAELHFKSRGEVQIGLEYDENAMDFSSFGRVNSSPNSLTIDRNAVRLRSNGENYYVVAFNRKSLRGFPLRYTVYRSDSPVYDNRLAVSPYSANER